MSHHNKAMYDVRNDEMLVYADAGWSYARIAAEFEVSYGVAYAGVSKARMRRARGRHAPPKQKIAPQKTTPPTRPPVVAPVALPRMDVILGAPQVRYLASIHLASRHLTGEI